jgi:SPP1 family predicted phage head-tail adaptor
MQAGRLRHRVYFDQYVVEIDSDGESTEEWQPAFGGIEIHARVRALSGRELVAAAAIHSKVSTEIQVRYRSGFAPSMRGRHDGITYDILAVIPDPESRRRWITLLCASGVNLG